MVDPDVDLIKDVRAVEAGDLDGCDCVMHLAAISNDPMGELNWPQLTFDINRDASIRLAELAKRAGVPRFLFAGSCSIYGKGELDLDEGDPLNPLTAYAKSKIETERAVSELADATFSPAYLRNATAYRSVADAADRPGGQQPAGLGHGLRRDPHPVRRLAWRP